MNNRVLVGGLIGGVCFFLLGYLIYGMALASTMEANMLPNLNRPMEEFQWAFLILSNLAFGFMVAYVLDKANATGFASGATVAAIVGFLMGLGYNGALYGTTTYWNSPTGLFIDTIMVTLIGAIVGGIIGWYYSRNRKVIVA
jgi:hypothetical protein